MGENGFNFLIVTGSCHFWARPNEWADVHEGDLSEPQASALSEALKLSQWSELRGEYSDGLCDGPTREYQFAGNKIAVYSICSGGSSPVNWLLNPTLSQLQSIYDSGLAVGGPVRVVLVAEPGDAFWPAWWVANAARWPSTSDPGTLALTYAQASTYQPGSSLLVTPPDADLLRSARRSFVEKGGPPMTGGFLPLLGTRDEKFEAFVRDSIVLEDAQGLLHLD